MTEFKPSQPLRILLVEDSEHDRVAFRRAFQNSTIPALITEYVRAEQALCVLRTEAANFDLIVTDYKLPGMTGLALCEELLQHQVALPLVLLTGSGSEHLAVDALKAGVNDYIIKDVNGGYLDLLPIVLPEVVRQYHDRLERQRAEEKIRSLNRELEQQLILSEKMAALGSLVAEVTHELNTPLGTSITVASNLSDQNQTLQNLLQTGTLKRSALESHLQREAETAHLLLSNLTRAADLIKTFKTIAVDRCSETFRRFNLKEYLNEVLFSMRPKLKKTAHTVTLNCPAQLELESDPGALSQIVSNLVMNSITHGFEPGEQGRITLDVQPDSEHVIFTYSDNGKGIAAEHLPHVFEPFFTTTRGQGGSGVGLHVIHKLITQTLHGEITCQSTPGDGATFTIRIPRQRGKEPAHAP
jgi:signal transduction histidine kinase